MINDKNSHPELVEGGHPELVEAGHPEGSTDPELVEGCLLIRNQEL